MEKMTFEEVVEAVQGKVYVDGKEYEYLKVSTDTRNIEKGSMFIGLRGNNFNGNQYVVEASEKGATICIVDEILFDTKALIGNTTIILVEDTKRALLHLAKAYRRKLSVKIIGITGSTGKTSTKDLVAAALSTKFKVFKTKGNFNNEIGLPLMMFQLDNSYEVAVLEMGMSSFGEIHRLAEVARPDIAVITNIGMSHIENLKTRENILKAKLEITDFFTTENTLVLNGDNDLLKDFSSSKFQVRTIGVEERKDFYASDLVFEESRVHFTVGEKDGKEKAKFTVDVPGKHTVFNSLLAIACGRILKIEYKDLIKGIVNLETTSMRLDITKEMGFTIVDDCYNASPDSMKAAIDVLMGIKGKRKIAVLGTMKELGTESYRVHEEVGQYAREKGVDTLLTVGDYNEAFSKGFGELKNYRGFQEIDELIQYIDEYIDKEDVVLVKASRSMKFEGIVKKLKYKKC